MPNFLAMSFEGELSPSFELRCLQGGRVLPDGWGIGFYPGGEPSAAVLKEPAPPAGSARSVLVQAWERVASSVFVLHIRAARWGSISDANTQPFSRSWGRRDWLFVHAGSLDQRLEPRPDALFEPIGSTDTELVFCELMDRVAARRWRSLAEIDAPTLRSWFASLNELGVLTSALTDGRDLVVYSDARGAQPVHLAQVVPPYQRVVFGDDDIQVDLTRRGAKARRGVIVASRPLDAESEFAAEWRELAPGSLVVVRQGAIMAELAPEPAGTGTSSAPPGKAGARLPPRPRTAPPRRLEVRHRTVYRYEQPVERSTHLLHLEPIHDRLQRLVSHLLHISVKCKANDYDDVFGNRARRLVIDTPFTELVIDSHALVVTTDVHPLEFRPLHARTAIPINWMPWQHQLMQPYLLPPELPQTQLIELHEYAMSFVERNDYDLVDALLDMNQSIYRDYTYESGLDNRGQHRLRRVHGAQGRVPGLHQPVHLPGPAARGAGPLRVRLSLHGAQAREPRHGRGDPRLGPGLPARGGLEGLRSDERRADPDRSHPGRGRTQLRRRHADIRDHLRGRRHRDAGGDRHRRGGGLRGLTDEVYPARAAPSARVAASRAFSNAVSVSSRASWECSAETIRRMRASPSGTTG